MESILELTKTIGPFATLLIFFVWRDYRREQAMTKRIQDIEDYQKEKLEKLVVTSTEAISRNATANDRLAKILEKKPCIAEEIRDN